MLIYLQDSVSLSGLVLPLLAMFGDLVKLILGETIQGDVEMRAGDIAACLKTRPLEKFLKPFHNFGVLCNRRYSREVCKYM